VYTLSSTHPTLASEKMIQQLAGIILNLPQEYLVDSLGVAITRQATCRYIQCLAQSDKSLPFTSEFFQSCWDRVIEASLADRDEGVQNVAVDSCRAIGLRVPDFFSGMIESLCLKIDSFNTLESMDKETFVTRGVSLLLGVLPRECVLDHSSRIIECLIRCATHRNEIKDAACRRNAVDSLIIILNHVSLRKEYVVLITYAFLECMRDYSIDSRGDVGSWVRDRAIKGLVSSARIMSEWSADESGVLMTRCLCAILQQSGEKIDRVRETAGTSINCILWMESWRVGETPCVVSSLRELLPKDVLDEINWLNPGQVFPILLPLLGIDECRTSLLKGVVVSVGGLTESLVLSLNLIIRFDILVNVYWITSTMYPKEVSHPSPLHYSKSLNLISKMIESRFHSSRSLIFCFLQMYVWI
jgi:hypothetical protein